MMERGDSIFTKISKNLEVQKNIHVLYNQTELNNSKYPTLSTLIFAPMCMIRVFLRASLFFAKASRFLRDVTHLRGFAMSALHFQSVEDGRPYMPSELSGL